MPGTATVAVGDTVKFVWEGGFHDVVFTDGQSSGAPHANAGTTYSRTFNAEGSFSYICTIHESLGMKGSITVQAAGSGGGDTTGTTVPGSLPYTGPEESILPILGIGLVGVGAIVIIRPRFRKE